MRSAQYDITRIVGLSKSPVTVLQKLKLKQNKIRSETEAETKCDSTTASAVVGHFLSNTKKRTHVHTHRQANSHTHTFILYKVVHTSRVCSHSKLP